MQVAVTTYTLEMRQRPDAVDPGAVDVRRAMRPNPALNRFFYATVGAEWLWWSRLPWSDEEWRAVMGREGHETWIGYVDGSPIGYFELDRTVRGAVEIACFGLLPEFVGEGLGGALLGHAIEEAWRPGSADRVWLNTCSLDHPRALPNYLVAGFEVTATVEGVAEIPDELMP